jgi:hypothetical protein
VRLTAGPSLRHGAKSVDGLQLWNQKLNAAVILNTNYRAQDDEEFTKILKNVRTNKVTQKDVDVLNSRVINKEKINNAIIVVPYNKHRHEIHRNLQSFRCRDNPSTLWRNGKPLLVLSTIMHSESLDKVQVHFRHSIWKYCNKKPQTLENKMRINLFLSFEHEYMLTQNLDVSEGISNGTPVKIDEILLHDKPIWIQEYNCHCTYIENVKGLILRHTLKQWKSFVHDERLGPGKFAIVSAGMNFSISLQTFSRKFTMRGFYLTPSTGITGHKSQGMMFEKMIISHFRDASLEKEWLYVALSRARHLVDIFLVDRLKLTDFEKDGSEFFEATQRLEALGLLTSQRLQSLLQDVWES